MDFQLRTCTTDDRPELEALIPLSVRTLQARDYSPQQIEGALGTVFGLDRQLIMDGTYFVAEVNRRIVACGGWSRRQALFGSGDIRSTVSPPGGFDPPQLDPTRDPARLRAFFVHPAFARRGIASALVAHSEDAARNHGFRTAVVVATLTGEPLYRRLGYQVTKKDRVQLPNGNSLPVIHLTKPLA